MKRMTLAIFATLLTMASTTFAATQATGTTSVSPTLQISVTVQDAVQLTLTNGPSASHCAITPNTPTTDYQMTFNSTDALAISNSSCGQKFAGASSGTGDAVYYTDYVLNPVYTSQASTTAPKITAWAKNPTTLTNVKIAWSSTGAAGSFAQMHTTAATADTLANNAASGTPITSYIGVDIAPTNGAGLTGTDNSAVVTFTLLVQ
jgi:hypothetical protein